MRMVVANRACGILYRYLRVNANGCFLLPANVCPVVPMTFVTAGVPFEFVDIDVNTFCIDEEMCLSKLAGGSYSGILFVHTYGCSYQAEDFFQAIKSIDSSLQIIDDKCLCRPDVTSRTPLADLTLFSTGYAKYLDFGKGAIGCLKEDSVLSNEFLPFFHLDIDRIYKPHFRDNSIIDYLPEGWLDTFVECSEINKECYFANIKQQLPIVAQKKQHLNEIYRSMLPGNICWDEDYCGWRFNIWVEDKSLLLSALSANGLFASSHYQPSSTLFGDDTYYPNSADVFNHVINLFNDKYYTDEQAALTAEVISRLV